MLSREHVSHPPSEACKSIEPHPNPFLDVTPVVGSPAMPSPEAGEGHHTESFKVVSSSEFDVDNLISDLDFTEAARRSCQSSEAHENPRTVTVPLKSDEAPTAIIKRPRSSGEPPSQGFKFGKAQEPQLDMTRKRGTKTQANELHESRAAKKQGHAGKLPCMLEGDYDSHMSSLVVNDSNVHETEAPPLNDASKNRNSQEPLVHRKAGKEQRNASEFQKRIDGVSNVQTDHLYVITPLFSDKITIAF